MRKAPRAMRPIRMSPALRNKLAAGIRKGRRETIYKMLAKRHGGHVPCFVCGAHVPEADATLEHIKPLSKGGTDNMDNLSISHSRCNHMRGNSSGAA